jgi:DNA adenine methylase
LVSNHDTEFTRNIYQGADMSELQVSRFISQNGSTRIKVAELLALFQV